MKDFLSWTTNVYPSVFVYNMTLFILRIAVSMQLIRVHGIKKLSENAADLPNPLLLPDLINYIFALSANLVFPVFVMIGLLTRVATIPILAVTLTGYFIVHRNDALQVADVPFMYSAFFLLILLLGPGRYSLDNLIFKKLKKYDNF